AEREHRPALAGGAALALGTDVAAATAVAAVGVGVRTDRQAADATGRALAERGGAVGDAAVRHAVGLADVLADAAHVAARAAVERIDRRGPAAAATLDRAERTLAHAVVAGLA